MNAIINIGHFTVLLLLWTIKQLRELEKEKCDAENTEQDKAGPAQSGGGCKEAVVTSQHNCYPRLNAADQHVVGEQAVMLARPEGEAHSEAAVSRAELLCNRSIFLNKALFCTTASDFCFS